MGRATRTAFRSSSKRRPEEEVGLRNEAADLVTKHTEKTEQLSVFFAVVLTGKFFPRISLGRIWED